MSELFDDIYIKKVTDKIFSINRITDDNLCKYTFTTPIGICPFGLEKYYNNYIINFEIPINKNKDFCDQIFLINEYFSSINEIYTENDTINLNNLNFYNFAKLNEYNNSLQIRLYLKKNKNKIISNFFDSNNKPLSVFDLQKNDKLKISVELNSIWLKKDNYGIILNIKSLNKTD